MRGAKKSWCCLGPVLERILSSREGLGDRDRPGLGDHVPRAAVAAAAAISARPATHIEIDYISMLAMAQKGIATAGIEKFWAFAGNLAAVKPDILDKLNSDQTIDEYAAALGVSPKIVVSDEDAAAARQGRAQQQQMQEAAALAAQGAQGAKTLSETDVGGGINALQMMLGTGATPQ